MEIWKSFLGFVFDWSKLKNDRSYSLLINDPRAGRHLCLNYLFQWWWRWQWWWWREVFFKSRICKCGKIALISSACRGYESKQSLQNTVDDRSKIAQRVFKIREQLIKRQDSNLRPFATKALNRHSSVIGFQVISNFLFGSAKFVWINKLIFSAICPHNISKEKFN